MSEFTQERALTPAVKALLHRLDEGFEARRRALVEERARQHAAMAGGTVAFREDTHGIREKEWRVSPSPDGLLERRVELLGGCSRPDLIDGLNAGAKSYIADLWGLNAGDNWSILRAHRNLERAARLDLAYVPAEGGRVRINPATTTRLMMAPRPIPAVETAFMLDHGPVAACLFDLALHITHCAAPLMERQGGMFLHLRDVRGQLEARFWADLLHTLEEHIDVPTGTLRATVMIDSVIGALEAEEILFELAHHAAGLSLDPQGHAADLIALHQEPESPVLPDRESIGLNSPFLRALSLHLIGICHKRGCHAIGAPSFVLPQPDPDKLAAEYLDMLADKEREAVDGHDGTIVVHPDTVNAAMMEFNKSMPKANQLYYQREDNIEATDLVRVPQGSITSESLVGMVRTVLRALVQRHDGLGRVVQGGRLHDRSSVRLAIRLMWQWVHGRHGVVTATGLDVRPELVGYLVRKETDKLFGGGTDDLRARANEAVDAIMGCVTGEELPSEPL